MVAASRDVVVLVRPSPLADRTATADLVDISGDVITYPGDPDFSFATQEATLSQNLPGEPHVL